MFSLAHTSDGGMNWGWGGAGTHINCALAQCHSSRQALKYICSLQWSGSPTDDDRDQVSLRQAGYMT